MVAQPNTCCWNPCLPIIIIPSGYHATGGAETIADGFRGARKAHEEMVDMLGITWLLSGTAFGHILGAGAILGMSASGIL